jgi:hypothetical protein
MRRFLQTLFSCSAVLFCALAIAPPPGFSLCIDADGHLVIEAGDQGSGMCCLPGFEARADEVCQPDDCTTCIDYALSADDVVRAAEGKGGLPDATLNAAAPAGPSPARAPSLPLPSRTLASRHPGATAPTPLRL